MAQRSDVNPFVTRLGHGPLLGDGAMGTELHLRSTPPGAASMT